MKASVSPLSAGLHNVEEDILAVVVVISQVEVVRLVNQQHPTHDLLVHRLGLGPAGDISKLAPGVDGDGKVTLNEVQVAVSHCLLQLDEALQVASVIVDALRLMPVPTLPLDVVQEYAISATERSGEQFVVNERMMQERALLPKFAVKEYFLKLFGKNLKEVVEISLVTWLLIAPLIAFDKKLNTATMNRL